MLNFLKLVRILNFVPDLRMFSETTPIWSSIFEFSMLNLTFLSNPFVFSEKMDDWLQDNNSIEMNFILTENCVEELFNNYGQWSTFLIRDSRENALAGLLECRKTPGDLNALKTVPAASKRTGNPAKCITKSKNRKVYSGSLVVPKGKKDIHTALEDLDLLPQLGSDLGCSMCPYIATKKSHLKTHYKLKHLGGADLIMTCQICSTKVKTKSYMKKHYMTVHNLTDTAAQNMASSST